MQRRNLRGVEVWYCAKPDDVAEMKQENEENSTAHCEWVVRLSSQASY